MKDVIEVPIFSDEYKVVCTWGDQRQWRRVAKAYGHSVREGDDILDGRFGVTLSTSGQHPLIVLPHFPKTPEHYAVLAHEAVHAIESIYDYMGAEGGGEVFANAVGAVVRIILRNRPKIQKKLTPRGENHEESRSGRHEDGPGDRRGL